MKPAPPPLPDRDNMPTLQVRYHLSVAPSEGASRAEAVLLEQSIDEAQLAGKVIYVHDLDA